MQLDDLLNLHQIPYTSDKIHKLLEYTDILLSWNKKMNLTAAKTKDEVFDHILDSAMPLVVIPEKLSGKIIDVGTGAGFPGIVLAVLCPEISFTLIDALQKRCTFLAEVQKELQLNNISIFHKRAETAGHDLLFREQFDLSVARAVAPLNVLLEYLLPFTKAQGCALAYKGPMVYNEASIAKKAVSELGGQECLIKKCPIEHMEHYLCIVQKTVNTKSRYPRTDGIPEKKPII